MRVSILIAVVGLNILFFLLPYQNHNGLPPDSPLGGQHVSAFEKVGGLSASGFLPVIGSGGQSASLLSLIISFIAVCIASFVFFSPSILTFEILFLKKKLSPLIHAGLFFQACIILFGIIAIYFLVLQGFRMVVMPGDGGYPSDTPSIAAYIHFLFLIITFVVSTIFVIRPRIFKNI